MRFLPSVLGALTLAGSMATADDRVPIHVRSAHNVDGFTDPDKHRRDSVNDLVKKLRDSKSLRVVDNAADAWALLEVLRRPRPRRARVPNRSRSLLDGRGLAGLRSRLLSLEGAGRNVVLLCTYRPGYRPCPPTPES